MWLNSHGQHTDISEEPYYPPEDVDKPMAEELADDTSGSRKKAPSQMAHDEDEDLAENEPSPNHAPWMGTWAEKMK